MIESARLAMRSRLLDVRDAVLGLDAPTLQPICDALMQTVDEPLRLAVVGKVKAGKSTLVNALIGRRVAPTDAAERTRIVTWYQYGTSERIELHLLDGSVVPLRGDSDVMLPDQLPVPISAVSHAVVHLREAPLRDYTLIDTPGLGSATVANEAATRRALLQAEQAHAAIYVIRDLELADDVAFLHEFAAALGSASATSVIGVLSHADVFGAGPWRSEDPVQEARAFAEQIADRRRGQLGAVVPVAALLAESVQTGRFTERDVASLAAIEEMDPEDIRYGDALPDGVGAEELEGLTERLGTYGVLHGRRVAEHGAVAFARWARDVSGASALERELRMRCLGRHAQLRAWQALAALDAAADRSPRRAEIREVIAEARLDPALHPLEELHALEALRTADPTSPLLPLLQRVIDADQDQYALELDGTPDRADVERAARAATRAMQREASISLLVAERHAAVVLGRSYRAILARWTA